MKEGREGQKERGGEGRRGEGREWEGEGQKGTGGEGRGEGTYAGHLCVALSEVSPVSCHEHAGKNKDLLVVLSMVWLLKFHLHSVTITVTIAGVYTFVEVQ